MTACGSSATRPLIQAIVQSKVSCVLPGSPAMDLPLHAHAHAPAARSHLALPPAVVQALAVDGPLTTDGEATFSKGTRTLGTAAAAELAVSGRLSAPDVTAARLNVTALLTSLGSTSLGSGAGSALVVSGPATFNAEILAAGGGWGTGWGGHKAHTVPSRGQTVRAAQLFSAEGMQAGRVHLSAICPCPAGATITDNLRVPSLAVDGAVSGKAWGSNAVRACTGASVIALGP